MPELTIITGQRDTKGGASEADHAMLRQARQEQRIRLWSAEGTAEECDASWRAFLLDGTPDWEIWS